MTTIYIVTKGRYSEYHICAVFDSDSLAEAYAQHVGAEVEEWELNQYADRIKEDRFPYLVQIYVDPNYVAADIRHLSILPMQREPYDPEILKTDFMEPDRPYLHMVVIAKNKEHAAKIAMEKRTQWLLENR